MNRVKRLSTPFFHMFHYYFLIYILQKNSFFQLLQLLFLLSLLFYDENIAITMYLCGKRKPEVKNYIKLKSLIKIVMKKSWLSFITNALLNNGKRNGIIYSKMLSNYFNRFFQHHFCVLATASFMKTYYCHYSFMVGFWVKWNFFMKTLKSDICCRDFLANWQRNGRQLAKFCVNLF